MDSLYDRALECKQKKDPDTCKWILQNAEKRIKEGAEELASIGSGDVWLVERENAAQKIEGISERNKMVENIYLETVSGTLPTTKPEKTVQTPSSKSPTTKRKKSSDIPCIFTCDD